MKVIKLGHYWSKGEKTTFAQVRDGNYFWDRNSLWEKISSSQIRMVSLNHMDGPIHEFRGNPDLITHEYINVVKSGRAEFLPPIREVEPDAYLDASYEDRFDIPDQE